MVMMMVLEERYIVYNQIAILYVVVIGLWTDDWKAAIHTGDRQNKMFFLATVECLG